MPAPPPVVAIDDAQLKTQVVVLLEAGPVTQADIGEAVGVEGHTLRFALRRLARVGLVAPTWIAGVPAWRLAQEKRTTTQKEPPMVIDEELEPIEGVSDPDVAAFDEEDAERVPDPPPQRSRAYKPGHRVPRGKAIDVSGTPSPWVGKPRDGFTAAMEERLPEMRSTRQAASVKGLSHTTDSKPARF